jgi:hypothetical protein
MALGQMFGAGPGFRRLREHRLLQTICAPVTGARLKN